MLNPNPSNFDTFPLAMARPGVRLQLVSLNGGRRMNHRLAEMGLTPGVEVTLLQDSGGPLLLSVRNSRIALGRTLAHKLAVFCIEDQKHD